MNSSAENVVGPLRRRPMRTPVLRALPWPARPVPSMFFYAERRVHHQHERHGRKQHDRREVLVRIVGQPLVEPRRHREGRGGADHDGGAVRLRAGNGRGAKRGAGAGAVLDDEGLTEPLLHAACDKARQRISAAAGRKRHDDFDWTIGIVLPERGARSEQKRNNNCYRSAEHISLHVMPGLAGPAFGWPECKLVPTSTPQCDSLKTMAGTSPAMTSMELQLNLRELSP